MSTPEIEQLIKKAESGDARAMFALAQRYRDGDGVTRDYAQFLQWLMQLCNRLGFAGRIQALLSFEGKSENELKSFVTWLQDSAVSGNAMHMNFLAILHKKGIGVGKDLVQYIGWLRKAIAAGDVASMNNLAWAYCDGEGVEKDLKKWIEWLQRSIKAGNAQSMSSYAWAYREGIGVGKDLTQYIEWLNKAIAAGDAWSMTSLAVAYREGEGIEKDSKQSIKWLRKASTAGSVEAMRNLAWAYHEGIGVKKDLKQFIEWLQKAIAEGDAWSMRGLAWAYREGIGVAADPQQSMHWFLRAAEGRDEYALDEVRRMYQSREFEKHSLDDDIAWLRRAAVIDDGNLYAELAVKHWTRNAEADHDKFRHWLGLGEHQGNVCAFIFGSLLRLSDSQSLDRARISDLCEAFFGLSGKVDEIKQQHLIRGGDKAIPEVAHFTTLDALHSMLPVSDEKTTEADCYSGQSRVLRLYHIAYMNDPQEGRRLLDMPHEDAELLHEFFPVAERGNNHNFLWENQEFSVYCGSFTLRVDRLDLWRAYGRDGAGYCVVIPVKVFQPEPESKSSHLVHDALRRRDDGELATAGASRRQAPALYRIRYQKDEVEETLATLKPGLEMIRGIKKTVNNPEATKMIDSLVRIVISDILYLYKNEEYASEEEARMIVARNIADQTLKLDDRQPPRVYVETEAFLFQDEGTRIIIGPKVADKVAAELNLKYRLARHGLLKTTAVEWSQVKYR
jgi:TPR repeat protein